MKTTNKNTALSRLINASLLWVIILINHISIFAQSAINNTNSAAHPAAVLDISSTEKGILIPRMSAIERNDIVDPANGLLVYQTNAPSGFYCYQDNSWSPINRSASSHPIGSIIDWWRPNAGFPVPPGYVICDGTAIINVLSPLNGNMTPDFTNKYVLGTSMMAEAGQSGGSSTHVHTVSANVNSALGFFHTHSFNYPNAFVSTDGNHNHATIGQNGYLGDTGAHSHSCAIYDQTNKNWSAINANGIMEELIDWGDGIDAGGTGHFPIQTNGFSTTLNTDNESAHNHTFSIPANMLSTTSGLHTHSAPGGIKNTVGSGSHLHQYNMGTIQSNVGSNHPKYIGLLKLMRIY